MVLGFIDVLCLNIGLHVFDYITWNRHLVLDRNTETDRNNNEVS